MDCLGPIVVLLIAAAQIIVQVRKSQEQARRRAMQSPPAERPPPPRLDPEMEEILTSEWREPEPRIAPAWVPPRAPAELVKRTPARATTRVAEAVKRHKVVRLNRARLRNAILLIEVLGPPVALRDPSPKG